MIALLLDINVLSMWYSAEQKVTKCHVFREGTKHFQHKQSVNIGKIEQTTYVDVVEW